MKIVFAFVLIAFWFSCEAQTYSDDAKMNVIENGRFAYRSIQIVLDSSVVIQFPDTNSTIATKADIEDLVIPGDIANMVEFSDTTTIIATKDDLSDVVNFSDTATTIATKTDLSSVSGVDDDTLTLSGIAPGIILDDQSVLHNSFMIFADSSSLRLRNVSDVRDDIFLDGEGRLGIGAKSPTEAKMYIYGGASGANIDARADVANASATFEAQSHDFETSFQSTWIQQSGTGVLGNAIDAIPNAGLGRLVFQNSDNALIYTVGADPLIFGTDFTERMRVKETGIINIKSLPTYTDDTAAGAGGLVQGDLYKTAAGALMIKL